jgi:hypothetical protein
VLASELMLTVTLLTDSAFEEEFKQEYPWMTAGIQGLSDFASGLFSRTENQGLIGTNYDSIQPYLGCLGLAAETRDAFKLEGVLRFIHQLECMDKRDRLYGTLALIQWRSPFGRKQAGARLTPDYEKNPFQLAAEVFSKISLGGIEDIGCALSWVQHFFEISGLDAGDHGDLSDYTRDYSWRSMRICDSSSPESREHHNLHCAEQFVTLLDYDGVLFAQAPLKTSAGDSYIEMNRLETTPKSWSALGIVIKDWPRCYQGQKLYSMLGLARRFSSQTSLSKRGWYNGESERFKLIDIYCDVYDKFLLYLSTLVQADFWFEYLVQIRICDPEKENSSFARFQRSADDTK